MSDTVDQRRFHDGLAVSQSQRERFDMQVNVSARHGNLQPGDHDLVEEKALKLRRLYDRVNAINVTIDLEHLDKPHVEIQVSVEHADDLVATAEATTVVAALDAAIPKAEQQLRKLKDRKTGHRATASKHIDAPSPSQAGASDD
ncbi:MAG: ribosome-associated translation inhibitor RaiA [Planctomycetota bacterium]